MTNTPPPKSKPLFLRLLPWIAVLMLLLCLLAVCEPFVAQYRAIKVLKGKGGIGIVHLEAPDWLPEFIDNKLSEEQTYFVYKVVGVKDIERRFSDAEMQLISLFSPLNFLNLSDSHVSDNGLKHLSGLTNLRRLVLTNTKVSDDGLKHLSSLTDLEWLVLNETKISDEGLKNLSKLTNLQILNLANTKVSGDNLKHLSGLSNLQKLRFNNTKVNDVSLKHLAGLTSLRDLDLEGTNVTLSGIKQLQLVLPECEISSDFD